MSTRENIRLIARAPLIITPGSVNFGILKKLKAKSRLCFFTK